MSSPDLRRTSQYLQQCLDRPNHEHAPAIVAERDPRLSWFYDWFGSVLLYQYEGLHHVWDSGGISSPDKGALDVALDDALSRMFVKSVPGMVKRLLTFERIVTEEKPNEQVAVYFEEAMHCYALGLHAAAVALARACLEHALRETVAIPHAATLDLDALITAANRTKILDGAHTQMAREVKQLGNQVLHRRRCTDAETLDSIINVRAVLQKLYGAESSE